MSVGRALGVCNASKSEQVKVDHMLDVVTKDNNNGRSALDKFRFRIYERNLELEEQRELSQLDEDQVKVHIISRDWLQCWGHWLHGGVPPSAIDQSILVDKNGRLRVPEKSLDGWSLGFIGPKLWNHLKKAWGVKGPELTEDDAQGEEYEEIRIRLKLWKQSLKNVAVSPT
ncbi:unnamed protein product [Umbelopsis sp. WA50703]